MPLYEYECLKNGHRFELIRKFSDPPLAKCTKCDSKVKRLISAPAIAFKGSGWYVNDYGKGNSGASGSRSSKEKDSGKSESASKSADTKAETKSESKKESKSSGSDAK